MYTRLVEITSKSGKGRELCNTIEDKVLPTLNKQRGFVDETVLVSDAEPNRIVGLSFWDNKEDAERYHREQYPQVHERRRILNHPPDHCTQSRVRHLLTRKGALRRAFSVSSRTSRLRG